MTIWKKKQQKKTPSKIQILGLTDGLVLNDHSFIENRMQRWKLVYNLWDNFKIPDENSSDLNWTVMAEVGRRDGL